MVEAKLTQTRTAFEKYRELYQPVVASAFKVEPRFVLVCRNLRYRPDVEVMGPDEAFKHSESTWHYTALHPQD